MLKKILFLFLIVIFSFNANAEKNLNPLTFSYDEYGESVYSKKIAVINWSSDDGIKMLERSKYKGDFFRLGHHFKAQEEPSTCGLAAASIVISGIYEQRDQKMPIYKVVPVNFNGKTVALEYRSWNEKNFVNDKTDQILDRRSIVMQYPHNKTGQIMGGMDLEEMTKMFKIHGVRSEVFHVSKVNETDISSFRNLVKNIVNDKKKFLLANYHRGYQGIEMGGHFSPIVGYDEENDSIMILDVATHKNPWIWVKLEDFYKSMNSKNYAGNEYRGYIVLYV